ncbi:MAG: epimerase, partial [Candidatus Komeilibacteria bacterium CG_4_10_14_0_2_um_filter_37_10]
MSSKLSLEQIITSLPGPILVFGANSFIGLNLIQTIAAQRTDCLAIINPQSTPWRLKLTDIPADKIRSCDITAPTDVQNLLQQWKPAIIFNLTAYGSNSIQQEAEKIYQTNLLGALNILQNAHTYQAYVQTGSSSEYGLNSSAPAENDLCQPNSHYAVAKLSSYYLLNYYGKILQKPVVHLRLYSIYGPWEEPNRLIPKIVATAQEKQFPPLVNPDISRDFVYISDCVEAIIRAAETIIKDQNVYGEAINIASGQKTTIAELADLVKKIFNISHDPQWGTMPDRQWDLVDWYGQFTKAQELLHWQPLTTLADGLQKTAAWQKLIDYQNVFLPAATATTKKKISCIVACYRDEQAVPYMHQRIIATMSKLDVNYEIIFVNDCSPDNTQAVLEKICAADHRVIAVTHSRNFGSQAAFISGLEIARGDAAVLMDGDLQDPPELITKFYEQWQGGYDIVYGRRVKREALWLMNIAYKLFYRIFKKLSYLNIPTDAGDFALLDRKVYQQLISFPEKDLFLRGLRAWIGYRQIGVDYLRPERMFGRTTNNLRKNIWWAKKAIFSFSYAPLEFLSDAGILLTLLSLLG